MMSRIVTVWRRVWIWRRVWVSGRIWICGFVITSWFCQFWVRWIWSSSHSFQMNLLFATKTFKSLNVHNFSFFYKFNFYIVIHNNPYLRLFISILIVSCSANRICISFWKLIYNWNTKLPFILVQNGRGLVLFVVYTIRLYRFLVKDISRKKW